MLLRSFLTQFLAALTWALAGSAMAAPQCEVQDSRVLGRAVNWCYERSRPEVAPSSGESVVYFMHGLGGGASTWELLGYSGELAKLREQGNYPPVTFVSFDTSQNSFFSNFEGTPSGPQAYESWFIEEFIPFVEAKLKVCHERQCRSLAGVSMGGLGALKTALRHSQLFSSVAVNSPALSPFNPFNGDDQWRAYFDRHPIGASNGMLLLGTVRTILKDRDNADHNDPAWLVENFEDPAALPSLYFDMGDRDNFGFQEGYARFKLALDKRGFPYEAHLVEGADHHLYRQRSTYLLQFLGAKLAGAWGSPR